MWARLGPGRSSFRAGQSPKTPKPQCHSATAGPAEPARLALAATLAASAASAKSPNRNPSTTQDTPGPLFGWLAGGAAAASAPPTRPPSPVFTPRATRSLALSRCPSPPGLVGSASRSPVSSSVPTTPDHHSRPPRVLLTESFDSFPPHRLLPTPPSSPHSSLLRPFTSRRHSAISIVDKRSARDNISALRSLPGLALPRLAQPASSWVTPA